MLHEAARLGQVVDRLDAPEEDHTVTLDRSPIAVPVLLALAIELALKALQWNERDGGHPAQTHDLLVLFKGLRKDTRERIEANMPEVPGVLPDLAELAGDQDRADTGQERLRRLADTRTNTLGSSSRPMSLKTALKAILDVHPVHVVRGPTLGNRGHRREGNYIPT